MSMVWVYVIAWLLPLLSFALLVLGGRHWGRFGAYVACGAIIASFFLSLFGLVRYAAATHGAIFAEAGHGAVHQAGEHEAGEQPAAAGGEAEPVVWAWQYDWIVVGPSADPPSDAVERPVVLPVGFYVDNLTALMFVMVTFIASLIHIYSTGYMHEELHDPVKDPLAVAAGQPPLERKGRYPRFFTYMSLFCFSMLGLVIADNIFMVFIFWELVGVCSYLLIGFYYERNSASTAANKAFITNRVGDFGMLIGMMIILTSFHTFNFAELSRIIPGAVPDQISHALLTIAGVGVFAGCVGKSAQFPLQVWLPDAMEGPTPVSALIHAATMVAAGVYLVGRFFFLFTADALLVIAYVGGITLFLAGTIACVMTDIKRVLAYSTVSQLGYMMLGLGVGGWAAGLFHLLTHAFFKALLFLNSGSVIHGTGTQEMPEMGGLGRKMPITAVTMFIAVLAICGIPLFSGYYSKDAIIAHALAFTVAHKNHPLLVVLPVVGAAITSFYMFRLFFMTFTGEPRDKHIHDHAHESGWRMAMPLVALAVPSMIVGYSFFGAGGPLLERMLSYKAPVELAHPSSGIHEMAGTISLFVVGLGILLSALFYYYKLFDPDEIPRQFPRAYRFLHNKWYFDELYDAVAVRPALRVATFCRGIDWNLLDRIIDGSARATTRVSDADGWIDNRIVDGVVNLVGDWVYAVGDRVRFLQTGQLRQYLVFLVVASVGLVTAFAYLNFLDPDIINTLFSTR